MTYRALKYITEGLLTGDNKLPKEDDIMKALLGMAYNHIANKCTVLNLMTLDRKADVLRMSGGVYMIRKPEMPLDELSELDIDDDLGYAAASLIASYVSKDKGQIHDARATTIIRDYNAKVTEIMQSLELQKDCSYTVIARDQ